jgi:autophagy-related protein 13
MGTSLMLAHAEMTAAAAVVTEHPHTQRQQQHHQDLISSPLSHDPCHYYTVMSHNELDKLTRFFIQKSSQVIVQSRLGGERIATRSNPRGKDWFSLSIPDDREVTDRTRKCLDTIAAEFEDKSISVTRNWHVCCEVSLKTSDDVCMVLEYWLFSNESLITTSANTRTRLTVPPEEVFTFYNRLTLLLKSIITLTRATPIHKISRSGQGPDTFVICYRIFDTTGPIDHLIPEKDKSKYSRVTKLGTVSCQFNRIAVTFSYRTNMATCNEDKSQSGPLLPLKMDHFKPDSPDPDADFSCSRKILAFASPKSESIQQKIEYHFPFL